MDIQCCANVTEAGSGDAQEKGIGWTGVRRGGKVRRKAVVARVGPFKNSPPDDCIGRSVDVRQVGTNGRTDAKLSHGACKSIGNSPIIKLPVTCIWNQTAVRPYPTAA